MSTTNQRLADAAIDRAVDIQQFANGVVRRAIAHLNRVDADIAAQLVQQLPMLEGSASAARLDDLLASVRAMLDRAYAAIGQDLPRDMFHLTTAEVGYQASLFEAAIPRQIVAAIGVARVEASQVYAAAMSRPFQGVLLREALRELPAAAAKVVRDQIRIGYTEQQTIAQIVRRIRGTKAAGYADGAMQAPKRHIEALVRTAVSHTAATARDAHYAANTDLIKAVRWVSTIDTKTSPPCRLRDGLRYSTDGHKPIGHSIPWAAGPGRMHWNCRSVAVPITKSWAELGIDRDEAGPGGRASMDGQIPAMTTYLEWLKRQSHGRQDQVLGPVRAQLFRAGKLSLRDMYDHRGRWLTLDELLARNDMPVAA